MFSIQATQIFGNKSFEKKVETIDEAMAIASAYRKGNCNVFLYRIEENGAYTQLPYRNY